MILDELHQQYGKQMVAFEILQGQIQETKKAIAKEMNAQKGTVQPELHD